MTTPTRNQAGFSLIELMVAMVVTLIVTGAIYGLLAGGQSAFRREPEMSERQQNTRLAMAMIEQDIGAAGVGLPPFTQIFSPALDGIGPNGQDGLEIVVGSPGCPLTDLCVRSADNGTNLVVETKIDLPNCAGVTAGAPLPTLGALRFSNGGAFNLAFIGPVRNLGINGAACTAAPGGGGPSPFGVVLNLDFGPVPLGWKHIQVDPVPALTPVSFVPVQVVRYIVATDPTDASNPGDPNFLHLWRSVTGGRSAADWANPTAPPGPEWQLVARGINDLQITYVDGTGQVAEPQMITAVPQWDRLVRQVNVTLFSRVAGLNIAGFTGTDGSDPNQIRLGQLVSQVAPRATLLALQDADPATAFRWK
jgi:prepilin-type N-terminal cleavage/methylation domain-containing protein